ncbi:hypothetical protein BC940DRAFT_19627 [Gongronella butleri]|nr:hypothetical protein BC940DRAFT_19627 [Gongronella butleri]
MKKGHQSFRSAFLSLFRLNFLCMDIRFINGLVDGKPTAGNQGVGAPAPTKGGSVQRATPQKPQRPTPRSGKKGKHQHLQQQGNKKQGKKLKRAPKTNKAGPADDMDFDQLLALHESNSQAPPPNAQPQAPKIAVEANKMAVPLQEMDNQEHMIPTVDDSDEVFLCKLFDSVTRGCARYDAQVESNGKPNTGVVRIQQLDNGSTLTFFVCKCIETPLSAR